MALASDTPTTFSGTYSENGSAFATLVGTLSGSSVSIDYQYISTGSYGMCSGSVSETELAVTCTQILGPEYGSDAGQVNGTTTDMLQRVP
jgi:hypothetical protein